MKEHPVSASRSRKDTLSVMLLVDSLIVPLWAAEMVRRLQESEFAAIDLVLVNTPDKSRLSSSFDWEHLLYRIHRALDRRLARGGRDPFAPTDLGPLLTRAEIIEVKPLQTKYSDRIPEAVCSQLLERGVDVGVRLGFRILRGSILSAARYGIWSYHHGDESVNRGGPPGFWEVIENWPLTGATLQILNEDLDAGTVLSKTASTTDPTLVSRNKSSLYWGAVPLLPRALRSLYEEGEEKFFSRSRGEKVVPRFYSRRLYQTPDNLQFLKSFGSHASRLVARLLQRFSHSERWMILFSYSESEARTESGRRFETLTPPSGHEWADPFVVWHEGEHHLFFEDLDRSRGKAQISTMTYTRESVWSNPLPALKRDYHLSYPFVFQHESEFYMVPETAENGTIELYRAKSFPCEWELVKVLLADVRARDTTLLQKDGRWWMFTCIQESAEMSSWQELFLFWSDNLLEGDWHSHPLNPIVTDAGSARPAGKIFEVDGRLFRPSQNCGGCYGRSVKFSRIDEISESSYIEVCVNEIEPSWDEAITRVHTYNYDKGLTVMDALTKEAKFGQR